MNRRRFIRAGITSVCLVGLGSTLRSFASGIPGRYDVSAISLRFAIASDGHYGQPNTLFDQYHDEMMAWINREHEQHPLSFTMFNGDLIHDEQNLMAQVKRKYDQLDMPYYVSRGNHDHGDEALWESTWNVKLNYSFEKGNSAFVVLNTANEKGDVICPDEGWAEQELKRYKNKKSLFVFMHVTPLTWTQNGIDCSELVALFRKQDNLKAVFHGHDHDQDDVMHEGGKPYFFDGHLGGSWGKEYRGYRIVEVFKNGTVLTYQVNPSVREKVNTFEVKK